MVSAFFAGFAVATVCWVVIMTLDHLVEHGVRPRTQVVGRDIQVLEWRTLKMKRVRVKTTTRERGWNHISEQTTEREYVAAGYYSWYDADTLEKATSGMGGEFSEACEVARIRHELREQTDA